jgi:hypothetical protein
MTTETLTPERILAAAEDVLRRHGHAKANVVDVAALPGSATAAFTTTSPARPRYATPSPNAGSRALRPLAAVTDEEGAAPERLQRWLDLLVSSKRRTAVRALVLAGLTAKTTS